MPISSNNIQRHFNVINQSRFMISIDIYFAISLGGRADARWLNYDSDLISWNLLRPLGSFLFKINNDLLLC